MILISVAKHFIRVTKHRWIVFKLCCKAGEPWRGLVHDLSKYSPTEFFESAKYYAEGISPVQNCRNINGYSKAWLHHKGKNKHHHEYWYDDCSKEKTLVMPYKYAVEMICDNLAAGMVYNKQWTQNSSLIYWTNRVEGKKKVNPKINIFAKTVFKQIGEQGINKTINKKNLKKIYNESVL